MDSNESLNEFYEKYKAQIMERMERIERLERVIQDDIIKVLEKKNGMQEINTQPSTGCNIEVKFGEPRYYGCVPMSIGNNTKTIQFSIDDKENCDWGIREM